MADCTLTLNCGQRGATVAPGEELSGEVVVKVDASCKCDGLTLHPEWTTSGRGNPVSGQGEKLVLFTGQWEAGEYRYRFNVRAPLGPFTYDGELLNIHWALKARADVPWAIDPKAEAPFTLKAGSGASELPYYFGPTYTPPDPKTQGVALSEGGKAIEKKPMGLGLKIFLGVFLLLAGGGIIVAVPMMAACIAPFVAFFLIRTAMVKSKLGEPEVKVFPNPVPSGEGLTVIARVVPKKAVKLGKLSAELLGQERVVRGSGKHQTTHTHRLFFQEVLFTYPQREVQGGEPMELRAALTLPPNAPLTFAAASNVVMWQVTLKIELLGWPDWSKTFPVTVRPKASLLPPTSFAAH